jgi:hypothetical protein
MPPDDAQPVPKWEPITEPQSVFRFVQHDSPEHPDFVSNFVCDADNPNQKAFEDEHPDYRLGMSVFATEEQARVVWATIAANLQARASPKNKRRNRPPRLKVGHYIAELALTPANGFELAGPPDDRGHMTLKGPAEALAAATQNVYPAARESA